MSVMNQGWRHCGWKWVLASSVIVGGALAFLGDCVLAQITPDKTLGSESSTVTSTGSVDQIDGGATRGANLFHSFKQFSVRTGSGAYFNNALDVQNIISRVTGSSISNIDGLLRANGTANLFLLNPNGIIFGPNASLNIGGSFVGSTASSLNFADGAKFSATAHPTTPLLTVSVPIGLQYGGTAGSILNQSQAINSSGQAVGLQVQPGETLALLGGDVRLDGGNLQAPGGRVELGGLAELGTIALSVDGNNLGLSFPNGVAWADVSLTNDASVDVRAGGGGSIALNTQNLDVLGGSELLAGIGEGLGSVGSQAGDITLNATGVITISQRSGIYNYVSSGATGNSGDINIKAGSLLLTDSARLNTQNIGQGDAGSVSVQANGDVSLAGFGRILSDNFGQGDAGSVSVQANGDVWIADTSSISSGNTLWISDISDISSITFGQGEGDAGSISVQANGDVWIANSFISSSSTGEGDAGSVSVQANGDISFAHGGIWSYTSGRGDAGSISVQANGDVFFAGGQIDNLSTGEGDAGSVSVQANGDISFATGGGIVSGSTGEGDAGSVSVQANGDVFLVDSIISSSQIYGRGKGGNIHIQARSVFVTDGASLQAETYGSGNAGNIQVNAIDSVTLSGYSGLSTSTEFFDFRVLPDNSGQGGEITVRTDTLRILSGAVLSARTRTDGDGGNITVNVNNLEITGGGQILTSAFTNGNAGSITVNATNSITLSGSDPTYFDRLAEFDGYLVDQASPASGLFANTGEDSSGQGGSLRIETGRLNVRDGAEVNVSSAGVGAAGDLAISAGFIRLDNQSSIQATTAAGNQGNIILRSQDLVLHRGSNITSNAIGTATGGNITIDTDVIAALENSDISANAQQGFGGRVRIDAQGIFGTEFRNQPTSLSDITATSDLGPQFSGTVEINTPDVDPNRGLANLPAVPIDIEVVQACQPGGSQQQSEFIVTGRGGLPPSPNDALDSDAIQVDWVTLNPGGENRSIPTFSTNPTVPAPAPLVEAQGWMINDKGEVILTAHAPNVTPKVPWMTPANCHSSTFNQQPLALGAR